MPSIWIRSQFEEFSFDYVFSKYFGKFSFFPHINRNISNNRYRTFRLLIFPSRSFFTSSLCSFIHLESRVVIVNIKWTDIYWNIKWYSSFDMTMDSWYRLQWEKDRKKEKKRCDKRYVSFQLCYKTLNDIKRNFFQMGSCHHFNVYLLWFYFPKYIRIWSSFFGSVESMA